MIAESEERLREYVENDKIYQDYKNNDKEPSDFERFCFVHCRDIENVLNENQQLKEELQKADSITQSCIFEGKEESEINFRKAINLIEQYKSVLDEIREYIKYNATSNYFDADTNMFRREVDILQILDKVQL